MDWIGVSQKYVIKSFIFIEGIVCVHRLLCIYYVIDI